jgi:glutathione synthase/RimK-type ligase-like ATP-grasp enzyme
VWLRDFDTKAIKVGYKEMIQTFSFQQWEDACRILQNSFRCEWINTPNTTKQAGDRMVQLSVAKALGFDIPATLITNDPMAAHDFYDTIMAT